ncbi:protein ANTI-SILENCING 1 isoform X1 [Senna tora]|uniref:Protein ANTI-SILENCING 1 isoform X1 n=1 Tax=Senna tora TaxID=362788 RepID=A0A834W8Q9_9FABA|nr:protein ANTI-SILENCING 1 isoform X1 [Senna tora]
MAALLGASLMAISPFYIHKRTVDQVLHRLIDIRHAPSRSSMEVVSNICRYYAMSRPTEANVEDETYFKWGNKSEVGVKNKDVQFYESFTYKGVEYFLYDCVYFYQEGDFETSIGKLVRIFETPTHEKKVQVVWLFRPVELRNYLGDYQPHWNELFLACGEGYGVSNVNLVEAIIGKCTVVCTAKDKRNCEAPESDLKMADFFFSCCFDVERLVIVDKFPDVIGGIKVKQFFKRKKVQNDQ